MTQLSDEEARIIAESREASLGVTNSPQQTGSISDEEAVIQRAYQKAGVPLPGTIDLNAPGMEEAVIDDARRNSLVGASELTPERMGGGSIRAQAVNNRGVFARAVERGWDQNVKGMLSQTTEVLGRTLGIEALQEFGEEGIREAYIQSILNPAEIASIDEIDDLADFGTFVIEQVGQQIPNLAFMAASYGVGGLAARGAAAGLAKYGTKRMAEAAVGKAALTKLGTGVLGTTALTSGEVAKELREAGYEPDALKVFGLGALSGALEFGSVASIYKGIFGKNVNTAMAHAFTEQTLRSVGLSAKTVLREVGKSSLKGIYKEGITEGMQETVNYSAVPGRAEKLLANVARQFNDPGYNFMEDPENAEYIDRIANAAAAGAAVGGVLGGAGTTVRSGLEIKSVQGRRARATREKDEAIKELDETVATESPVDSRGQIQPSLFDFSGTRQSVEQTLAKVVGAFDTAKSFVANKSETAGQNAGMAAATAEKVRQEANSTLEGLLKRLDIAESYTQVKSAVEKNLVALQQRIDGLPTENVIDSMKDVQASQKNVSEKIRSLKDKQKAALKSRDLGTIKNTLKEAVTVLNETVNNAEDSPNSATAKQLKTLMEISKSLTAAKTREQSAQLQAAKDALFAARERIDQLGETVSEKLREQVASRLDPDGLSVEGIAAGDFNPDSDFLSEPIGAQAAAVEAVRAGKKQAALVSRRVGRDSDVVSGMVRIDAPQAGGVIITTKENANAVRQALAEGKVGQALGYNASENRTQGRGDEQVATTTYNGEVIQDVTEVPEAMKPAFEAGQRIGDTEIRTVGDALLERLNRLKESLSTDIENSQANAAQIYRNVREAFETHKEISRIPDSTILYGDFTVGDLRDARFDGDDILADILEDPQLREIIADMADGTVVDTYVDAMQVGGEVVQKYYIARNNRIVAYEDVLDEGGVEVTPEKVRGSAVRTKTKQQIEKAIERHHQRLKDKGLPVNGTWEPMWDDNLGGWVIAQKFPENFDETLIQQRLKAMRKTGRNMFDKRPDLVVEFRNNEGTKTRLYVPDIVRLGRLDRSQKYDGVNTMLDVKADFLHGMAMLMEYGYYMPESWQGQPPADQTIIGAITWKELTTDINDALVRIESVLRDPRASMEDKRAARGRLYQLGVDSKLVWSNTVETNIMGAIRVLRESLIENPSKRTVKWAVKNQNILKTHLAERSKVLKLLNEHGHPKTSADRKSAIFDEIQKMGLDQGMYPFTRDGSINTYKLRQLTEYVNSLRKQNDFYNQVIAAGKDSGVVTISDAQQEVIDNAKKILAEHGLRPEDAVRHEELGMYIDYDPDFQEAIDDALGIEDADENYTWHVVEETGADRATADFETTAQQRRLTDRSKRGRKTPKNLTQAERKKVLERTNENNRKRALAERNAERAARGLPPVEGINARTESLNQSKVEGLIPELASNAAFKLAIKIAAGIGNSQSKLPIIRKAAQGFAKTIEAMPEDSRDDALRQIAYLRFLGKTPPKKIEMDTGFMKVNPADVRMAGDIINFLDLTVHFLKDPQDKQLQEGMYKAIKKELFKPDGFDKMMAELEAEKKAEHEARLKKLRDLTNGATSLVDIMRSQWKHIVSAGNLPREVWVAVSDTLNVAVKGDPVRKIGVDLTGSGWGPQITKLLRTLDLDTDVIVVDESTATNLAGAYLALSEGILAADPESPVGRHLQAIANTIGKASIFETSGGAWALTGLALDGVNVPTIVGMSKKMTKGREFVLAHELGHVVQSSIISNAPREIYDAFMTGWGDSFHTRNEVIADVLAGKLLDLMGMDTSQKREGYVQEGISEEAQVYTNRIAKAWRDIINWAQQTFQLEEGVYDFLDVWMSHKRGEPLTVRQKNNLSPLGKMVADQLEAAGPWGTRPTTYRNRREDKAHPRKGMDATEQWIENSGLSVEGIGLSTENVDTQSKEFMDRAIEWANKQWEFWRENPAGAMRALTYTVGGEMRSFGKMMGQLAAEFDPLPGEQGLYGESVYQQIERQGGPFYAALAEIMKEIPGLDTKEALMQAFRMFNDPEYVPPDNEMTRKLMQIQTDLFFEKDSQDPTVRKIRNLLDEMHTFYTADPNTTEWVNVTVGKKTMQLKPLGLKLKYRKNYFPVVWNVEAIKKNKSEFIEILMQGEGMTRKQAEDVANAFINDSQHGLMSEIDPDVEDQIYGPGFQFKRARKWSKQTRNALITRGFHQRDIQTVMNLYMGSMMRRGVMESRYRETRHLDENLSEAKRIQYIETYKAYNIDINDPLARIKLQIERAREAGELNEWRYRRMMDDIVPALFGRQGMGMSNRTRKIMSGLVAYQNIRLLGLSLFSSFTDFGTLLNRAGMASFSEKGLHKLIQEATSEDARLMAQMLGILRDGVTQHVLNDAVVNSHMSSGAQRVNDLFFRYNGMEGWTNMMRTLAMLTGREFINRHARLAAEGDARSKQYLEDLGLTVEDVRAWDGQSLHNEKIAKALHRFVDESMIRPNAGNRPAWGSDPYYALFFHLKPFLYGFYTTFIRRVFYESKIYSQHWGKYAGAMPFVMIGLMTLPFAASGWELRKKLSGSTYNPSGLSYMMELTERAGLYGPFQMALDMESASDFGKPFMFGVLGPAPEQLYDLVTRDLSYTLPRAMPVVAIMPGLR